MASLNITITPQSNTRRVSVELDADKLEKLAADLGFFNNDFLKSIGRAEKDYRSGRMKVIESLKELRK